MKNLLLAVSLLLSFPAFAADVEVCSIQHYVAMTGSQVPADMEEVLLDSGGNQRPGIFGIQIVANWSDLEATEDTYVFATIDAWMDELASINDGLTDPAYFFELYVMVHWKGFGGSNNPNPSWVTVGTQISSDAKTAVYFQATTGNDLRELYEEIGNEYVPAGVKDREFGGIIMQESALGLGTFDKNALGNYLDSLGFSTDNQRREYRKAAVAAAADVEPANVVAFYTFSSVDYAGAGRDTSFEDTKTNLDYRTDVAYTLKNDTNQATLFIGGPDILPESGSLETHVYPLHDKAGYDDTAEIRVAYASQYNGYNHAVGDAYDTFYPSGPDTYWPPQKLIEWAASELNTEMIFWTNASRSPGYGIDDVLGTLLVDPWECDGGGECHP